jgi:predicted kinase
MDQTRHADAWQIAFERIQAALVSGLDVIVDATNYKVEDRKRLIDFCKQWPSVKVSGMYVMTPYQVCLANNEAHEHVVPAHAMERMHKALSDDPPVKSEGWDVLERRFI